MMKSTYVSKEKSAPRRERNSCTLITDGQTDGLVVCGGHYARLKTDDKRILEKYILKKEFNSIGIFSGVGREPWLKLSNGV